MEFLYEYGLFFAKTLTFVIALVVIIAVIAGAAHKQKPKKGELEVTDLSEGFLETRNGLKAELLTKDERKKFEKSLKKEEKEAKPESKPRLFVLDFKGSMDAHEVEALREEVSAVIAVAEKEDEVLLRLESPGGVVHGYGLAASQLTRLKQHNIPLTVCVDKVAASGGYMMACVADKIISAPFAIIGSIGVIAQMPNFNKLLKKHDIEFEQHTAGEFKRTLTIFGENSDKAREKFQGELEETHVLFKDFVSEHRSELDIAKVATGEHWFGTQAQELGLVDSISTSDDVLLEQVEKKRVMLVKFQTPKKLAEKLGIAAADGVARMFNRLVRQAAAWQK